MASGKIYDDIFLLMLSCLSSVYIVTRASFLMSVVVFGNLIFKFQVVSALLNIYYL